MQLLLCALLLLKNVNVVDIDSGAIVAGRSVVVSEGYIKEIGAQETVRAPAGARVIDGSGRYLMPALWDMHTHPMEPEALSMLVCARRADLSAEEVRGFCRPLIADYKLPELFRIGNEPLLRNQNGKFDKPALRAQAAATRPVRHAN